jgi:monoamine oxidase
MARTPLLQAFVELARDHRIAEERNISPAEARKERREKSREVTRREFLGATAVIGAGLFLDAIPFVRTLSAKTTPRIAIVGAGIAGLTAALTLSDAGFPATVYEASGRIGGRMFSDRRGKWADRQVTEWCGELIDTGHKTIRSLARRFHLPLEDLRAAQPPGSTDTYFIGGMYYTEADRDFRPVFRALQRDVEAAGYPTTYLENTPAGIALDSTSLYQWIEENVPGGHHSKFGTLLDFAYTSAYGADTTDQSALNLIYLLGFGSTPRNFELFGESDERFHIRGGNQQLPLAIARTLGDRVQKGWRLTEIARRADETVTLDFLTPRGAKKVVADYVILALPFAVLRNLDYRQAGFDSLKERAIEEQGASRNVKLHLQFLSRLWNQPGPWGISTGTTYSERYQITWEVTRSQPGEHGILVDYIGGDRAERAFTPSGPYTTIEGDPEVRREAERFLNRLEPVFPGIAELWNQQATLSVPHLDPNLTLAYSYYRVGQYHTFGGYEKIPQGNIHFAGEHCSQDFQGFMEGGASEGIRVASEILTAVGAKNG